jgi:hypothetical protein
MLRKTWAGWTAIKRLPLGPDIHVRMTLMFTQDPRSEFFDSESFVEDNLTQLRILYDDACCYIPEGQEDREEHIAFMVAAAVFADRDTVEPPIAYDEGDAEKLIELGERIVSLMAIFSLEDQGLVKWAGKCIVLTEEGHRRGKELFDKHLGF